MTEQVLIQRWQARPCHCGASVGMFHNEGCDMELCSKCGGQLAFCDCRGDLPYRIPYIRIPNLCALCGEQWPEMFTVSNEEWMLYVIPPLQQEMLCRECYDAQKRLFPNGWRSVPQ